MSEYVAFLRGMNVGGHRLTNAELRMHFTAMGFEQVATFRASGNVVFAAAAGQEREIAVRIEHGLAAALGYEVPTFIRSAAEMRALAALRPFDAGDVRRSAGKPQVALLSEPRRPASARRRSRWPARATGSRSAHVSCIGCQAEESSIRSST